MKKLGLSMLAVGVATALFAGAANAESISPSSDSANTLTVSQTNNTVVTQSGITMKLQGLVFDVNDYKTGKSVTPKNDSPFRYYESDDGQHRILCQGNPEFGQTVIGRYYANYGIKEVLHASKMGAKVVKVFVDPSAERYTSAYNLKGYTFVTDYLEF